MSCYGVVVNLETVPVDRLAKELPTLENLEREYVQKLLVKQPNKTRVAEVLGIDRRTLYRKLERWGLE